MVKIISTIAILLTSTLSLISQNTVSGIVSDNNGEPIFGASIYLKNAVIGTVSDMNGFYSFNLNDNQFKTDTLVVTYIGFKSLEEPINQTNTINLTLNPSAIQVDKVTVTAIGIKKDERKLGYSATDVAAEELEKSGEINVADALNSKVAGVQVTSSSGSPGASTTVVIRGNKSISGNNSPLYVVDGVPIDNTYRGSNFTDQANRVIDINPDDIESMTVLKGGAATALYGVRAANGAVIINTKTGKDGKMKVSYSSSILIDNVNKLPEVQTKYGQGESGVFIPGSRFSWGPSMDTMSYNGDSNYPYHSSGMLVPINDPTANGMAAETYDNTQNFFQTGITANNHLSIEGGNENSTFYLSIGNSRQNGIIPNTTYNRNSIKLTGKTKLYEKLEVTSSINYINSNASRGQRGSNLSGVMLGLMRAPNSFDITNGFENPVDNELAYSFEDGNQRTFHAAYDNPFWSVNRNANNTKLDRVITFIELKMNLTENIKILERASMDYYSDRLKSHWDGLSNEYKDLGGRIFNQEVSQRNINSDFLITYNKVFRDSYDVTATVGHNFTDFTTTILETDGFGFVIPEFYDISNTSIINAFADDFITRERGHGVFGDLNLGYKNFLFLNVTGRNDWLSNLPVENRSFFYSSYSLSWIFTENLKGNRIDYGKFRVSYANTGNGAPAPYLTSNFFVQSGESVQGLVSYFPNSTIGNNRLRPENTSTFEIGTDLRFLNNRIGLDLTYYYASTIDQIIDVPIPTSTGYSRLVTNGGEIQNSGIEALLNFEMLQGDDDDPNKLKWDMSLNFTRNRNKVVKLTEELENIPLPSFGVASTQSRVIVGQPYGVIFGTRWLRDENNNVLIDENGFPIRDSENGIVGDPNPNFLLGFRNDLEWRNFNFSFLFDIRVGGDMYNGTVGVMKYHGTHISTENRDEEIVFEGVMQSTGENNSTPINIADLYTRYGLTYISEENIEEVNWLRLRDLSITYRFDKSKLEKLKLTGASISFFSRNLFLFTNYQGIDPETTLSGAANSFGRDYFNSPATRSFGLRLRITI